MKTKILTNELTDETVWYANDVKTDTSSWLYSISESDKEEILAALKMANSRGCSYNSICKNDFPLHDLGRYLDSLQIKLDKGHGFTVLRGIPIDGLSIEETKLMFAGLMGYLGKPLHVNNKGVLIDHVTDIGANYSDISVRGNTTNASLTPHCDSGDLVTLLCIRPAKEGGMSHISCSMAIYNEILRSHPEYIEPLCKGFYHNIRNNGPVGDYHNITKHRVPVYSYYGGMLSARYNQKGILSTEELPNVKPLTELEKNAINYVAELANRDDIRFDLTLESGDIILLNNYSVFHSRDSFVDHESQDKKRMLLRQWINMDNVRPLTDDFADHFNTGPRGGPNILNS